MELSKAYGLAVQAAWLSWPSSSVWVINPVRRL